MTSLVHRNEHGQPIGPPLDGWTPPGLTRHESLVGRYVRLEPMSARHCAPLHLAFDGAPESLWTYLPYGPPTTEDDFSSWLSMFEGQGFQPYAVEIDHPSGVVGFVCHLRIDPAAGSTEVGAVTFSPHLQRSPASTEAQYLLMRHAFDSGYRRYEWKCDDLNAPSRAAAERLGFTYEGTFRQATIYKGRSRDTAWYSILDTEWPAIDDGFRRWLSPDNFDARGRQRERLQDLRRRSRYRRHNDGNGAT